MILMHALTSGIQLVEMSGEKTKNQIVTIEYWTSQFSPEILNM